MAVGSYMACLEYNIIMCFVSKILKHVICPYNIKGFSSYFIVNTFRFGYAFEPIILLWSMVCIKQLLFTHFTVQLLTGQVDLLSCESLTKRVFALCVQNVDLF